MFTQQERKRTHMNEFVGRWIALAVMTVLLIVGGSVPAWSQATCTAGVGLCAGYVTLFAQVTLAAAVVVSVVFWSREAIYFRRARNRAYENGKEGEICPISPANCRYPFFFGRVRGGEGEANR